MSRTDKTKPWWVRVAEHKLIEVHNHIGGVCTLPESPYQRLSRHEGCHYRDWNLCYKGNCCYGCGCRMCTGYYERKADRRKSRHQARIELRDAYKEFYAWKGLE
jgi:hypothetical protein